MPAGPSRGMVLSMTEPGSGSRRVELDFIAGVEPVQGHARGADGMEQAFVGWLELVELLDRARTCRSPGPPEPTTAQDGDPS
jgi:hypothetical protein